MPTKHPDHDQPQHGTYATVNDVALRWGREASDAEAALIDLRLGDVERMILRQIPDLALRITDGRVSRADVVQVEAEVVLRLMRNPQGFISETDGDYSYQIARELSTGRLNILDEEWRALGYRPARMSILVPEPVVEGFEALDAASKKTDQPFQIVVEDEAALLPHPQLAIAVTRTDRQLWLYDPSSVRANPAGWVKVGGVGSDVMDGVEQGQLLVWDVRLKKWVPGSRSFTISEGATLVWSNAAREWVVSPNQFNDLTDVSVSARKGGGALKTGDVIEYDDVAQRWFAVPASEFVAKIVLGTPVSGDMMIFDGTNWVNAAGYTKADVDQKLANVVSGLARKPAVQDITDTPPPAPVIGQNYIVGKTPNGVWASHANEVTFWDGGNWIFEPPLKGDTHTNLTTNQSMTWNGTDWVSLGSQASALKDLAGVALTTPGTSQVLTFDGTNWINKAIPVPPLPSLDQLTDVDTAAAGDTNVLMFDGTSGTWKPTGMPAGTLATLKDVALAVPANGDVLMFDTSAKAWVGKAPNLVTSPLDGLVDVDATDPDDGDMLVFDDASKSWVNTKVLTVDELELSSGGLVEQLVEDTADALDDMTAVPNVAALRKYVAAEKSDIRLEELTDCTELSGAVAGQVPVWSDTNDRWEPSIPTQSLKGLSDVLLNTPTDKTVLSYQTLTGKWEAWGLSLDELADCNDLSAATDGQVVSWDDTRKQWVPVSPVRGGGTFASLTDVDVTTVPPVDGQSLKFNGTTSKWEPVAAPYSKTEVDTKVAPLATKVELDSKVQTLLTGLEHGVAAQSLTNTPPTTPVADEFYIVGAAGTGVWAGHNNAVTYWDGTAWQFSTPQANETHLVEDQQATFHWNGTAWVKVASAAVGGPSAIGDLWAVGSIQQSLLTEGQFRTAMGLNSAEDRKWVLADGRDVTGSQYHTITGHDHVPDLRGAFLRMAGTNAGNTSWVGGALMAWQEDNTARPKTAFTTDSQGSHTHNVWSRRMSQYSGAGYSAALGTLSEGINAGGTVSTDGRFMDPDGAHTHTITGGGDTETRPKNYSVNYFIKVN